MEFGFHLNTLLCASNDKLDPNSIWKIIYPSLLQEEHADVCKPLINILRIQIIGTVEGNPNIYDLDALKQPRSSSVLLCHRSSALEMTYLSKFHKECHKRKFCEEHTHRHWEERTPLIHAKHQRLAREWSRRRMRLANRLVSFN